MRKIALVCLFVMAAALTGCGPSEPPAQDFSQPEETAPPQQEAQPTETPTEAPTEAPKEPEETPQAQPAETASPEPVQTPEPTPENKTVGAASTKVLDHDADRTKNLKLAVASVNGTTLNPGETFSFNKVVGVRSKQRGYRDAIIYVDDEKKEATGGGVCQISSTLFQAARSGGFEIVERHEHTLDVPYANKGDDAAVAYGTLDFQFKNTKDYPVFITMKVDNDKVTAVIQRK